MKITLKRALCLFAAVLMLVFAFSACGDSSKSNETSSVGNAGSANSSDIIVEPNKPDILQGSKYDPATWNPYATISDSIKG